MDRLPYVMLPLVLSLAYLPKLIVAVAMHKQLGRYDNALPRASYDRLTGLGARALGAHMNGLEAFASFAVGVLACVITEVDRSLVGWLSAAFVVARVAYVTFYLADVPTARSAVWGVGFMITVTLLVLPIAQ